MDETKFYIEDRTNKRYNITGRSLEKENIRWNIEDTVYKVNYKKNIIEHIRYNMEDRVPKRRLRQQEGD